MSRIVIIGCGLGGLTFALKYTGDAEIIIYEKSKREDLAFPWCDTIRLSSFEDNGFIIPKAALEKKKLFNISIPDGVGKLSQRKKLETERAEINRKELIEYFLDVASYRAKINFEQGVNSLIINNDVVEGVVLNSGEMVAADLVIDASGAFSTIRGLLPIEEQSYQPLNDETLYYYRAYFKANSDIAEPEYDSVYLKSFGENAISWVRTAPNDCVDVFIAHIGELSDDFVAKSIDDLKLRHERISNEPVFMRKGKLALRHPLSQIVFNGFALVGDSAYMSMPLTGSGMDNAIYAGVLLAETVNSCGGDFSIAKLWKYQSKYFRSLGSSMYAADVFLRIGTQLDEKEISWFFDEILTGLDGVKDMQKKLKVLINRKGTTKTGLKYLTMALRAKSFAMLVPPIYEQTTVEMWIKKYDEYIRQLF